MHRVLIPVRHVPGRHCASTAISDLSRFHGPELSEAMCFGIGAGLGIWYLEDIPDSPSRMIHVRSADIEAQFFKRMGLPFAWSMHDDPTAALDALCASLDRGLPVLVQTDIFHLGYYGSSTHFPGHDIVVWGYDAHEKVFYATDTERPGVIPVPFDEMRLAMYAKGGIFPLKGNQFAPEKISHPVDLRQVIRGAIVYNSRMILSKDMAIQGLQCLKRWMTQILTVWPGLPDRRWAARFAYQVIERRGTGGGGFRLMYADFLDEASSFCPAIASLGLNAMMREAADAWTRLALALKEASDAPGGDFTTVSRAIREVHDAESAYHHAAVALESR
jgi:hypothetical protein